MEEPNTMNYVKETSDYGQLKENSLKPQKENSLKPYVMIVTLIQSIRDHKTNEQCCWKYRQYKITCRCN